MKESGLTYHEVSEDMMDEMKRLGKTLHCPACNSKSKVFIENKTVIFKPICHQEFANDIDGEIIFFEMNMIAAVFRGRYLNLFTKLESYMEDIILMYSFDKPEDFIKYSQIFLKGDMTMNVKKELFSICVEKYAERTGSKLDGLIEHLKNVIEKRNHLAHWVLDDTEQGRIYFRKTKKIRFAIVQKGKVIFDYFDLEGLKKAELKLINVTGCVFKILLAIRPPGSPQ